MLKYECYHNSLFTKIVIITYKNMEDGGGSYTVHAFTRVEMNTTISVQYRTYNCAKDFFPLVSYMYR